MAARKKTTTRKRAARKKTTRKKPGIRKAPGRKSARKAAPRRAVAPREKRVQATDEETCGQIEKTAASVHSTIKKSGRPDLSLPVRSLSNVS